MTTVGYGDAAPVTIAGRMLAMVFMIVGIGLAGVITATISSLFVRAELQSDDKHLHQQLYRVEQQLAAMHDELARLSVLLAARTTDDSKSEAS